MVNHVLVAVDDSEPASHALEFTVTEHADAKITALHVIDSRNLYGATGFEDGMIDYGAVIEAQEKRTERLLDEMRERAESHGVDIETDHVVGQVSRSVLSYADEHDVDHIVVGSHGRKGATRVLLGSVAERITRRSPVPVTVVR